MVLNFEELLPLETLAPFARSRTAAGAAGTTDTVNSPDILRATSRSDST